MKAAVKILIIAGKLFLGVLIGLVIFISVSIQPVDRYDYHDKDFYLRMQEHLEGLNDLKIPVPRSQFHVGFAKQNITPPFETSMAGSGLRRAAFEEIGDSIFVRSIVISNGTNRVSLVSLDMLLVPPLVTAALEEKLPSIGFTLENTYLSATHTHSSIGNWGEGLAGKIYSGAYSDSLIQFITDKIITSLTQADHNKVEAKIRAGVIPVSGILYNRLAREDGTIDSLMRIIEFDRVDGRNLLLCTFTGHPTCDKSRSLSISRDYPGVLVDELENNKYTFAMFMAGAVGSHACNGPERGKTRMNFVGKKLASVLLEHVDSLKLVSDSSLFMIRVPMELGESQLRISKDWRMRPWLFEKVVGTYPSYLTGLRIGSVAMLGTPCDYSGELTPAIDSAATALHMEPIVTSFNGGYVGYITLDRHYDINHYETRLMNWYGPGNGKYITECMKKILKAIGQ
jgi:hypothetical protein